VKILEIKDFSRVGDKTSTLGFFFASQEPNISTVEFKSGTNVDVDR
jgi:hypothetical protein